MSGFPSSLRPNTIPSYSTQTLPTSHTQVQDASPQGGERASQRMGRRHIAPSPQMFRWSRGNWRFGGTPVSPGLRDSNSSSLSPRQAPTLPTCLPPLGKEGAGRTDPLYSGAQGGIQGCAVARDAFNQQTPRKHPLRAHALLSWNSWALSPECHPLLLQLSWIEIETKGSF